MEGTRAKPGNQLVYNNESFGKWCTDFYLQIFTKRSSNTNVTQIQLCAMYIFQVN